MPHINKSMLLERMWDRTRNVNTLFFTQQSSCSSFQKHCRVKTHIKSVLEATSLNKNAETDSQHFCYKQPLSFNIAVLFQLCSLQCNFIIHILIVWVFSVCVCPSPAHSAEIIAVDLALLSDYTDSSSTEFQHQ